MRLSWLCHMTMDPLRRLMWHALRPGGHAEPGKPRSWEQDGHSHNVHDTVHVPFLGSQLHNASQPGVHLRSGDPFFFVSKHALCSQPCQAERCTPRASGPSVRAAPPGTALCQRSLPGPVLTAHRAQHLVLGAARVND